MKTLHTSLATALMAMLMVGCASDTLVAPEDNMSAKVDATDAIGFGSYTRPKTRVSHEESAALLGNRFHVYGTKTKGTTVSPVFDNYVVEYESSTAGKSATNTHDWEYVGKESKKGAVQGVKYWDFSAERFDFVAAAGIADDEIINNTNESMRINVADPAAMTSIYVADRITATPTAKAATATEPATTAYKDVVQFQFRRLGAQMRIGFYETVPGYAVKDLIFYYIGAPSGSREVGVGTAFPQNGKYTVTYDDATNAAKVKFAGAGNTLAFTGNFGKLDYTYANTQEGVTAKPYLDLDGTATATQVKAFLGTTSTQATYGKGSYTIDGKPNQTSAYKPILPYEENSLKMQIRVDYTLIALDGSGDSIHVRDAYVSVPAEYLKWKPNYSYTYLFKISDNSNGYTGNGGGGTITTGPGRDPDPEKGGDNDPIRVDPETGDVIPPYIPDPSYPEIQDPAYPDDPTKTIPDPDAPLIPNPEYPNGEIVPPYVPDPTWPEIPDPDDPDKTIPDPNAPLIPNPDYPNGPKGDQHDPSNPVPTPTIPDPDNPGSEITDPENPSNLFPITFDAVVIEAEDNSTTVYTVVDGTDNSSETEH